MKLLITGALSLNDEQLNTIENMGHEIVYMKNEAESLPCSCLDVEGIICNGLFLYHPIEKFTSLRYIQLTSAGFDRVPMDFVKQKGIKIFNARGVYSIPMAEFALCGVLSLYKKIRFFDKNQKLHRWEKNRELGELFNKNILIVGAGNVGQECAQRFLMMGCRVFGADIVSNNSEYFEEIYSMNELHIPLSIADVVILTLPLTNETKNLFSTDIFSKMKYGAVFVNISRGAIVNTVHLISALKTKLAGAVLDVFEEEPLGENNELWDMDNVIITPHNSFVGEGNNKRLFDLIINNLTKEA